MPVDGDCGDRQNVILAFCLTRSQPIGGAGKNAAPLKFAPNRRRRHMRSFFSNFDKCRPEVADDVISGVAVY